MAWGRRPEVHEWRPAHAQDIFPPSPALPRAAALPVHPETPPAASVHVPLPARPLLPDWLAWLRAFQSLERRRPQTRAHAHLRLLAAISAPLRSRSRAQVQTAR